MTALLSHIDALIKKRGPISIADYMELALQHPEFGYYRHGDPLGQSGDFTTAPEINQMFGEMIGLWCADVWREMGSPEKFIMLELGPGRGTLMQDALRATAKIRGFHQAMKLCLIESNDTLRQMQQEKLSEHEPEYIADIASLPPLPLLAIANEFFDALPVRQFEKTFEGWCERRVTIENNQLGFVFQPLDPAMAFLIPYDMREALPGAVHEISMASLSVMRDLAKHVVRHNGAALIIDYGYVEASGKPTLQAVVGHEYTNVLENPGEFDVTAHVNFAALRNASLTQNALSQGPIGQGEFLQALGIELRATQLKQTAAPQQSKSIDEALHRLTHVSEMGALFKVMAVASPSLSSLPGF